MPRSSTIRYEALIKRCKGLRLDAIHPKSNKSSFGTTNSLHCSILFMYSDTPIESHSAISLNRKSSLGTKALFVFWGEISGQFTLTIVPKVSSPSPIFVVLRHDSFRLYLGLIGLSLLSLRFCLDFVFKD